MKKLILTLFLSGSIILALPVHVASYKAPIQEPVVEVVVPKKPSIKEYAEQATIKAFGGQWTAMNTIVAKESRNWTVTTAHYPKSKKSTAYGLGGFLDKTWGTVGCKKTSDPYTQINCTIKYVKKNYKTPENALQHHKKFNWY